MGAQTSLVADVSAVFERACQERDLEVAEYLFQALEAIAHRQNDDAALRQAFSVLLDTLPQHSTH